MHGCERSLRQQEVGISGQALWLCTMRSCPVSPCSEFDIERHASSTTQRETKAIGLNVELLWVPLQSDSAGKMVAAHVQAPV